MISPALAVVVTFVLLPSLTALFISVFNWDFISGPPKFVAMRNYDELLHDRLWWQSLIQTVLFGALTVPPTTIFGFLLAWALHSRLRGRTAMQVVIFSPYVLPAIATIISWEWIFNTDYGLLNALLKRLLHLPAVDWLGDPHWVLSAMAIYAIWQGTGFSMLVYLSGLANVPSELVDAAKVDGARQPRIARHLLIPLVSPTTYTIVILSAIASFKVFSLSYLLTDGTGGPQLAGLTVGLYLYLQAFTYFHPTYAAAISVAFFGVVVVLTVIGTKAGHRSVYYR